MNGPRRIAFLLVAVLLLAGCGAGDHATKKADSRTASEPSAERDSGGGGEEDDKSGLEAIAAADRHAFFQIAIATSDLTTGASVLLVHGLVRRQDREVLRQVRPQVVALEPRDPRLRRLRREMLGALLRAIAARADHPGDREGRAMLADAARIRDGLKRYSNGHPAIGGMAPD